LKTNRLDHRDRGHTRHVRAPGLKPARVSFGVRELNVLHRAVQAHEGPAFRGRDQHARDLRHLGEAEAGTGSNVQQLGHCSVSALQVAVLALDHLAVPIRQLDLVVGRGADLANVDGHVSAGLGLKFCERPDGQRPGLRLVRRVDDDMEGQRGDVKSGRSRSPLI